MKRTLLFIACMLASLTMLAQDELAVEDIKNSGCLTQTRGGESDPLPTIVLTKEGNILSVQLLNFESNCVTADFIVTSTISGASGATPCSVNVSVTPYLPGDILASCECPYNISFTLRDLEANTFYLKCWWYEGLVTLEESKPLVLEDIWEKVTVDDVKYTLRKAFGCAKIEDGSTQKGEYCIPSELNYEGKTYTVTSIDYSAFKDNKNLTKVTIPQTIKNMDLSNNVGFNTNPFSGCTALKSIEVEEGNPALSSLDGVLFNKEKTCLFSYPADAQRTSYTIPEGVNSVAWLAFSYSQHLQKVSMSDEVTSLSGSAFYESKSLEEVKMPSKLTYLGNWLFANCSRLKSVTIPQGVTSIGRNAFQGCTSLTSVTMPESVTEADYSVFEGCTSLESVTLSPNLERIMNHMFANCYKLKELLIPDGVTMILSEVFENCSSLKTLDLPESIYRLGDRVFAGCNLDTLYIRGIIESRWMVDDIFRDMGTHTKLYVQPSEVEKFKAIYKGPVYPIPESDTDDSDYIPFVELGKKWNVVYSVTNSYAHCYLGKYQMSEEVERDGKTYVHAYLRLDDDTGTWYNAGLFREENRRVYKYDETAGREFMLYDFSLKEGDTFIYEPDLYQSYNCKVLKQGWLDDGPQIATSCTLTADGTLDIKYRPLRTWTIGHDDGKGNYYEDITWVECIGALRNMFFSPYNVGNMICLAYIERTDHETDYYKNVYLPFSLYQMYGPVYGCDLPTYGEGNYESDGRHHLNYELEGNRLHVYGEVFTQCGPNNYAYFISDSDNIYVETSIRKFHLEIQEVEPLMDCCALYATDFYVDGFDPAFDYIIVDNQGEEHPVIKNPADYRPMVEDGKVWQVGAIDTGNPVQWVEYYYFDGETVIDGKNCKQMMWKQYINPDLGVSYSNNSPEYVGAWYEEDKKVYAYDESDKQFKLMYDFSLDDNATLQMDDQTYMIGPRQAGGMNYFKGMWRNVWKYENGETTYQYAPWLEGVGTVYGPPTINLFSVALGDPMWFLMSCTVGDEVIYYDGFSEDGATPGGMNAPKRRFDFTHTTKTRPKTPNRRSEEQSLYGEYNDQLLGINLNPLDETYQVRITDQAGKVVYEKDVNAGSIVGLNIDISAYAKGSYTITMENSQELFTGEFETETTGIEGVRSKGVEARDYIYNLQGQRLESVPRKGIYIQNGKMYVAK